MSINLKIEECQAKHGTNKSLEFRFNAESWFGGPAYLVDLDGRLFYNNYMLSEKIYFNSYNFQSNPMFYLGKENLNFRGNLETHLSTEAIKHIEETRRDGDIQFTLKIIYKWQKILNPEKMTSENIQDGNVLVGPVRWSVTEPFFGVARSSWLQILERLGYSEIELFEVNKLSFSNDEKLGKAYEYLQEAKNQLRLNNYDGVLTDCKAAFESAAKFAAAGQVKQGYELISEKVFPGLTEKQKPFNDMIQSISDFMQLGRHAGYPHISISRAEAEFIYVSTLNILSFVSRGFKTTQN